MAKHAYAEFAASLLAALCSTANAASYAASYVASYAASYFAVNPRRNTASNTWQSAIAVSSSFTKLAVLRPAEVSRCSHVATNTASFARR